MFSAYGAVPICGLVTTALRGSADRRRQPLVYENRHFNAAVLFAAIACVVFGDGFKLAESERVDHAVERNVVVLSQIPPHGIGAALAEYTIFRLRAVGRSVTGHLNEVTFLGLSLLGDFVERRFGVIRKHSAVDFEVHRDFLLFIVVIDLRNPVVGGLDVGASGLGGCESVVGGLLGGFSAAASRVRYGGQFFELAGETLGVLLSRGNPGLGRIYATFGGGRTRFEWDGAGIDRTRHAEVVVGEFHPVGDQSSSVAAASFDLNLKTAQQGRD